MIKTELDFVRTLRAFSIDPSEENRRELLVASFPAANDVDECNWPMMVASAIALVSVLSEVRDDTPRLMSIASIAGDYAVALTLHNRKFTPPALPENPAEHARPRRAAVDAGLKVPETPAAPIRQYKDD